MSDKIRIVEQYFDAWDAHDGQAVLMTFNQGGTYCDPASGTIRGDAIKEYVDTLCTAFPDLRIELICSQAADNGVIAAPWLLFGTHQGELLGNPPTDKKLVLQGCDFIRVGDSGIDSVRGYFDTEELMAQLGLSA